MQARPRQSNAPLMILLLVAAVAFVALAVFYFTANTSLLASEQGKHYKHGILALVLAAASLVGANFVRNRA